MARSEGPIRLDVCHAFVTLPVPFPLLHAFIIVYMWCVGIHGLRIPPRSPPPALYLAHHCSHSPRLHLGTYALRCCLGRLFTVFWTLGDKPVPTVVCRSPYGEAGTENLADLFLPFGFASVMQVRFGRMVPETVSNDVEINFAAATASTHHQRNVSITTHTCCHH